MYLFADEHSACHGQLSVGTLWVHYVAEQEAFRRWFELSDPVHPREYPNRFTSSPPLCQDKHAQNIDLAENVQAPSLLKC